MNAPILENAEKLMDKYPKVTKALEEWIYLVLDNNSPTNVKDLLKAILHYDPRKLYGFFDHHEVIISVGYNAELKRYNSHNSEDRLSSSFTTRPEAEIAAFEHAFASLEKKL